MPRHVLAMTLVLLLAGCGGGSPAAPSPLVPPPVPPFQQHASDHFTFHFTSMDAASMAGTAASVEAQYERIVADLGSPAVARIAVFLHPDLPSMRAAVEGIVGPLPSFAVGLVTNASTIHVISPNLTSTWPYAQGVRAIVHEFAHCVSMHVNASIANNPRWLWEAVALYENNEFVDPRLVMALVSGQPPGVARLNGFDNRDIYDVGFTIGEFIVARWGRDGLLALIRNNGNTSPVTGLTASALMDAWYGFVSSRYLSGPP
jgi:hypothetical protein